MAFNSCTCLHLAMQCLKQQLCQGRSKGGPPQCQYMKSDPLCCQAYDCLQATAAECIEQHHSTQVVVHIHGGEDFTSGFCTCRTTVQSNDGHERGKQAQHILADIKHAIAAQLSTTNHSTDVASCIPAHPPALPAYIASAQVDT